MKQRCAVQARVNKANHPSRCLTGTYQEAVFHAISRIRVHLHLGNRLGNTAESTGGPIGKNLNSEEATRRPRCSGLSRASSTRGCRLHTRGCRMQQKEESQRKESRSST